MGQKFLLKMTKQGGVVQVPLEQYTMTGPSSEVTVEKVKVVGNSLGIDWNSIAMTELFEGTKEELSEHADVLGSDLEKGIRIAYAHLKEIPDYYTRLKAMEAQAGKDKEPNTDKNLSNASSGTER